MLVIKTHNRKLKRKKTVKYTITLRYAYAMTNYWLRNSSGLPVSIFLHLTNRQFSTVYTLIDHRNNNNNKNNNNNNNNNIN